MAIGTPVDQGHASSFSSATSNAITTLASIGAGDSIIVLGYANTSGDDIASVTDTAGNSYSQIATVTTSPVLSVWACSNAVASNSGMIITVSYNGTGTIRHGAQAISVSGLGNLDIVSANAHGTGTSATSVSTGTLTAQPELVLGCFVAGTDPGTFTPGGSFTQVGSGGPSAWPFICWQTVNSTASVSWAPSWVTSLSWRTIEVTFFAKGTQGFFPPDVPLPVRLAPSAVSLRVFDDRPKLTLRGKDAFFAVGEPPTPPDVSNPVLAKPNLELRTFLQPLALNLYKRDVVYGVAGEPAPPLDLPNPLPPRGLAVQPPGQNGALNIPVFPFIPVLSNSENPLRAAFVDAVVCNLALSMEVVPPFKVRPPDNPLRYRQLVEYPIPPNLTAIISPPGAPFRTIIANPISRTAAEILRLGEQLAVDILGIIQQPAPPIDWPNPRGYPFPMGITADPGFQSEQSNLLLATTPIGQGNINPSLPVLKTPSFINFDAAPPNLLSSSLLPQPLPPGSLENIFAALPPRGYVGYSQYEVGSPNATATTLQTVFPPPGIPYPYEELYQYFPRPPLPLTAFLEGSQSNLLLGGALNIPPISDQLLDYFFQTIAIRTAYAFLYDAGPPSQLGNVLAPVSAPPGDLYIKQHRMGAPGFPLMGEPH